MAKTKEPLRRAAPEVRHFVDQLLLAGYSPPRVRRILEGVAADDGERQRLFPLATREDVLGVSERSIYERQAWLRQQRGAAGLPADDGWYWWGEQDPEVARHVLTATAQYEVVTGRPWPLLTRELVAKFQHLVGLAPGLPLPAVLVLAQWWLNWEHLPDRARHQRLTALGTFLAFCPWTSPEAAEYYRWVAGRSGVRIELVKGLPILVVAGWRLELEQETAGRG